MNELFLDKQNFRELTTRRPILHIQELKINKVIVNISKAGKYKKPICLIFNDSKRKLSMSKIIAMYLGYQGIYKNEM